MFRENPLKPAIVVILEQFRRAGVVERGLDDFLPRDFRHL